MRFNFRNTFRTMTLQKYYEGYLMVFYEIRVGFTSHPCVIYIGRLGTYIYAIYLYQVVLILKSI